MSTLDFELKVSSGTGHIYSVVARAPGGEAAAIMRLPVTLAELDQQIAVVRDRVLASSVVSRGGPAPDERPGRDLGQRLFEVLIAGDVRSLYTASRQRAQEQNSALRLVLQVRPPELARLPWELLFDAGTQDYLGLTMPLVRYPEVLAPRQPLQLTLPLRILGMVARPGDQYAVDADEEQRRRLNTALADLEREGLVELSWVAGPTYSALEDALQRGPWHIFHFIGRSGRNQDTEEGALALADPTGLSRWIDADKLSRLFAEHHPLRLVVLNACDTGRASSLDPFASIAGALVRRWIPAVVALPVELSEPAAAVFARTFYQSIATRRPVDDSVLRARRALRVDSGNPLEWGAPVLYLRATEGRIFGNASPPPPQLHPPQDPVSAPEVEALYDQALAAYWTERWDQAIVLLEQVLRHGPEQHSDVAVKLEQARRQQQLATHYSQGCAAAEALDWDQAVKAFTMAAKIEPAYRDVGPRLDHARRRQQLASWQAEARRLHQAGEWAAVVKIGERLHILDPAGADPEGLVSSARAELTSARREVEIAQQYRRGLRLLDAGQWQQAIDALDPLASSYRDTAALLARARRELPPASTVSPLPSPSVAAHPAAVRLLRHRKAVSAVVFSPDGHRLATIGADRSARIWDAVSGREYLIMIHKGVRSNARGRPTNLRGRAVAFSPNGYWLATASDDHTARIWDAGNGAQLAAFAHDNVVVGVVFSPNGRWLATAGADHTARIWDAGNGAQLAAFAHDNVVAGVAFSPNGYWLATASEDHTARIWDAAHGQPLTTVTHTKPVHGVAFSPNGRWLATASADHTARIWDAGNGRQLATLTHDNAVTGVAFSPNGHVLATASADHTARIWDAGNGRQLATLTHDNAVTGVAFSPNGHALATASRGKAVRIWALDGESHHGAHGE